MVDLGTLTFDAINGYFLAVAAPATYLKATSATFPSMNTTTQ